MKIAILGATGRTGLVLVRQALDQGHDVLALVRNPQAMTKQIQHERLKAYQVDLNDEATIVRPLKEADAVMSCIGAPPSSSFFKSTTLYQDSAVVIVSAMRQTGLKKLVIMSGSGTKGEQGEMFLARVLRPLLKNLKSMASMEDYLEQQCADINYTVVRPPGLNEKPSTNKEIKSREGQYVPNAALYMPRADVARFMLSCLETDNYDRKMVAISV
ncbi:flavin reductase (NADPH)-like [Pomacea canaliculata]|uniref:flavin reductase (NADPH)-like n=1 Tax=Pomacea canaliculata TaxID=400727 RepID=UPI000D72FEE7|nr:flavin reductase (NADPH)-like [Pomacea canaliculata]